MHYKLRRPLGVLENSLVKFYQYLYDLWAVTLARALNLWVACAFGKISIIPWSSSCTSPGPDSSQGSLEFRWSPGDEHRNIWLQLNIVWWDLGILGKVGLSVLATKCCHLPVLWGQDLLHVQSVCRLNKVDGNLPQRRPINVFFAGMALLLLKLFKNFRLA